MIIELPFKTPSVNHLYFHRGNIKILSTEARHLSKQIEAIVGPFLSQIEEIKDKHLKVSVEIHEDWYTKKNEVYKKDVANREKFLIDQIFKFLGIDDKYIFEINVKKIQNILTEKAVITILPI